MMKTVINAEDTKQRANLPSSPRQGTTTRFKSRRAPKKQKKTKECVKEQEQKKKSQLGEKSTYVRTSLRWKGTGMGGSGGLFGKKFFFEGKGKTNKQKKRWKAKAETCDDVASTHEMRKGEKRSAATVR